MPWSLSVVNGAFTVCGPYSVEKVYVSDREISFIDMYSVPAAMGARS